MKTLPYILIVIAILIAGGIYIDKTSKTNSDGTKTNSVSSLLGIDNAKDEKPAEIKSQGPAPEFTGITKWLNSEPLTMQSLKGKVVLIDFWTYSCINCIRTLPYVTKWYDTYKDQGFVVIGVHTPEFDFEKVTKNVETANKRYKINYPVAQDNDFATWNAYKNQYWPAHYLIDQQGNIVYTHFGEGNYDVTESAIRQLLGLDGKTTNIEDSQTGKIGSPEMYFGSNRVEHLAQKFSNTLEPQRFGFSTVQNLNEFQLEGDWIIEPEKVVLASGNGRIRLRYQARDVHMVAASKLGSKLKIFINNEEVAPVTIGDSQLYTLYSAEENNERTIIIEISGAGFEAFTFTFG